MGQRGPGKQTTAFKLLKGDAGRRTKKESKRKRPPIEPARRPKWIQGDAKLAWDQLAPVLKKQGMLSKLDTHALATYCSLYARYKDAERNIKKHGAVLVIKDKKGLPKYAQQSPYVGMANRLAAELRQYMKEFGLTPSSRVGFDVMTPADDDDEFDKWNSRRRS